MGTLVVLLLIAVAAWIVWKLFNKPDANEDGKVDHQDVKVAATEVAKTVANTLDVNKDGKVNLADVKAAGEKVAKKVSKPRAKKAK